VSAPFGPPLLIANPAAGRGRGSALESLREALRVRGVAHDLALTEAPGHASVLAREAAERGRRYVVAVGGDGTVHEVVNGLVDVETGEPRGEDLVLGIASAGSGSDLARTFGLDRKPAVVARHLDGETTMPFDLGRVRLQTRHGDQRSVLFANIAEAGYGGLVTDLANRLPRFVGKARYGIAILGAVRRFELVRTRVAVDHTSVEEELSNVIVANGQFFGGGLRVAPRALSDDGRFNVQVWRGKPIDVLRATPDLRVGDHLDREDVREWQSTTVTVDADSPLIIEADGEVLGTTPAAFDLLPQVLRIKV
jgi:diacylglycerol kinase (ATP)